MTRAAPSPLARIRKICLSLPETTERLSHGAPSFFIRDKVGFVNYMDNHHDDGRLALWCACPAGMREGLLRAQPDQYFVPPYVGVRGWIGVRLDRGPDWDAVERVIRDAYLAVAPKRVVAAFLNR
ncbi:MAG: phosphoribosylglycinamide formyltransferase [Chloroflexi bacterium 13_1_40CM_67_9]|nr:MAG: phosphoribosylglycinamide formyltransferase [Chloroflexi bacterium 13_1_40CM_67_9]